MRDPEELTSALSRSSFRAKFHLDPRDREYLLDRGLPVIMGHARDFIERRLSPAEPLNEGRQTPMKGHPVFVAQHATATCCRGCLQKWHYIKAGATLRTSEIEHVLSVVMGWLTMEAANSSQTQQEEQLPGAEPL